MYISILKYKYIGRTISCSTYFNFSCTHYLKHLKKITKRSLEYSQAKTFVSSFSPNILNKKIYIKIFKKCVDLNFVSETTSVW